MTRGPFEIAGYGITPGERRSLRIPLPQQSSYTPVSMPIHVIHGTKDGPTLFVSAAIHGDEINGVEIIRRLMRRKMLRRVKGTLILAPIVNVYGFITHSRYLPDGRDLNRSFPGSVRGSLAARLADTFTREILARCTHGVDLHTGGGHRTNHPHVRANVDDAETRAMADAFGAPVVINANLRDGSLRQVAAEMGVKMLLYEAGGALRFEELPVRAGVSGVFNLMRHIGMLPKRKSYPKTTIAHASSSAWIRAASGGLLVSDVPLGAVVKKGEELAILADALGEDSVPVIAPADGIIIGRTKLPVINEGDALFHLAQFADTKVASSALGTFYDRNLEGLGSGDYAVPSQ